MPLSTTLSYEIAQITQMQRDQLADIRIVFYNKNPSQNSTCNCNCKGMKKALGSAQA
jgi:hypothetical protein